MKRLKNTEALKREKSELKKYLNLAGVIIVAVNNNNEVTFVNKKGCQILGYRKDDIMGKNWIDNFFPKIEREKIKSLSDKLLTGKIKHLRNLETPLLTGKGKERIIAWNNTLLKDENGNINGYLTSGEDITTYRRTQEALRESEMRYRLLFNTGNDAVFVYKLTTQNRPGKFIEVNHVFSRKLGYTKKELLNMSPADIYDSREKEHSREIMKKLLSRKNVLYEIICTTKDRKRIPFEINSYLLDLNGKSRVLSIARDISRRRKNEGVIRKSLEEKEVLLKEIHHRVKNNMQIIYSMLNLQSRFISNEKVIDILRETQGRVMTMALIHEKLYQSKEMARIDFNDYIQKLLTGMLSTYGITSGKFELELNVKDIYLDISTAIPCGLIINELVSNSLKHAYPKHRNYGMRGKKKNKVCIDISPDRDNKLSLRVRDNGIGFPEDFDFQHTDSLGLQLVNTLVEQMDGSIKLNSKNGTSFKITFPA